MIYPLVTVPHKQFKGHKSHRFQVFKKLSTNHKYTQESKENKKNITTNTILTLQMQPNSKLISKLLVGTEHSPKWRPESSQLNQ